MTSLINTSKPNAGAAQTADVRQNFSYAKSEIENLQQRGGFVDYNDTATTGTPIAVSASTWTKLTNNKLGANTKIDRLPSPITNLWDTTNNQLVLNEAALNTRFRFRLDVTVTTSGANQQVDFRTAFAVGSGNPFFLYDKTIYYKTSGAHKIAVYGSFYIGSTLMQTYPAEFQIFSDSTCTVVVSGWYIEVDGQ